jgi:hypothetical protein
MVQPAITNVAKEGETGALFFNGEFSHAIRRGPYLNLGGTMIQSV